MRTALLGVLVCGCGGAGSTGLDDGGKDGNVADSNPTDGNGNSDVNANEAGTDANGADGADASTFNVKGVTGLALWLKGDTGVVVGGGGGITSWADQSGNGNNATPTAPEVAPTVLASGINTLPSIHFASTACGQCQPYPFVGNDLNIAASATMDWGTSDYLVEVVARYTNDPTSVHGDAFGAIFISIYGPPNNATSGIGLYGNVFKEPNDLATSSAIEAFINGQPAATSSGTGYNNDMPHVFAMQRAGTTLSVRIDGVSVGSSTVTSTNIGDNGGRMGGCENASAQRLEGDIAEVIAVQGTIAPSDLTNIEAYLQARYATP
jgi:hypothetical protein